MSDKSVPKETDRLLQNEQTPASSKEAGSDIPEARNGRASIRQEWIIRISPRGRNWLMGFGALALLTVLGLVFWPRHESASQIQEQTPEQTSHEGGTGSKVELSPESLAAAGIETATVTQRPAVARLRATGTVEANQQRTQQITPLVAGRVERVNAVLGDRVQAGAVLAVISSPEIASMHGKLHESETRLDLAERTLERVQQAENRVAVLQAKARLDEAEANLRRTKRLMDLGAGAGKDLIATETAYKTAKAEYDYQINISVNREVQEARAEVEIARVEVSHLRNSLRAQGAAVSEESDGRTSHDTSIIQLHAPISGTVTERLVNAGAGIEAGKPLFTVANIATLWVIANVPESQVGLLKVSIPAEVRAAVLGQNAITGRITYIDPILNQEARTARVRVEVPNSDERLKVGMFVEVGFQTGTAMGDELVVPEEAVQRIGERNIVFGAERRTGSFRGA